MGQKVSPIGFRTGITKGWKSRWFAPKSNYGEFLVEDERIRRFINLQLNEQPPYAAVASVEIERTREEVKVVLRTARPGLVIGPKGVEVDRLKGELERLTDRRVNVNIVEIKNPDLNAQLVASGIAEQLRRRASFRRTMKQRCESTMNAGAKGVKIRCSGRLGGAEMSRTETQILGSIPLQTLDADVDYGLVHAKTTYGTLGVKVWIYRGMKNEAISDEVTGPVTAGPRRRGGGPGGPGGGGPSRGRGGGGGRGGRGGRGGGRGSAEPASGGGPSAAAQGGETAPQA
jgi:small subunit ribosomal protein S3